MKILSNFFGVGLLLFVASLQASEESTLEMRDDELLALYAEKIVPIMKRDCISCHGEDKQKGDEFLPESSR